MFTLRRKPEPPSVLDKAIADLAAELENGYDEQSKAQAEVVKLLMEAKALEKPDHVSASTMAAVAGNLAGIILILLFERKNVIGSKALMLIPKLRI